MTTSIYGTDLKRRKPHHSEARYRFYELRRALRVAIRETGKVTMDVMLYGTGFMSYAGDGVPVRLTPATVWFYPK